MKKIVSLLLVFVLIYGVVTILRDDSADEKSNTNTSDSYNQVQPNTNGYYSNNYYVNDSTRYENNEKDDPITCWSCYGDGKCDFCGGSGEYEHYPDWAGTTCRTCNGSGKCPGCNGKGVYN